MEDQLQIASSASGIYIMTSTGEGEAFEGEKYGIYTKHLIEGIESGRADENKDGLITLEELFKYVENKVRDECNQKPKKWGLDAEGALVIARSNRSKITKKFCPKCGAKFEENAKFCSYCGLTLSSLKDETPNSEYGLKPPITLHQKDNFQKPDKKCENFRSKTSKK